MKTISVITPCFNEQDNVREVYERVRSVVATLGKYRYEHIFIDNASTDGTRAVLKEIAAADRNVKVIFNMRNFGHIRSPMHAFTQASGDAVVSIVADLQDPPELISEFVKHWESGALTVLAIKRSAQEGRPLFLIRRAFYRLIRRLASTETYDDFTGFGLFDRIVVDAIKACNDPYPYLRGIIAEIGAPCVRVPYDQPKRKRGHSKNNFYSLYDMAMLGITNLSKVPLRLVTFTGFLSATACILVGFAYCVYKLIYWDRFSVGVAPLVIGLFFFASIQLLSMGIVGEYIGSIHTFVQRRPYVFEQERLNFEYGPGRPDQTNAAPAPPAAMSARAGDTN